MNRNPDWLDKRLRPALQVAILLTLSSWLGCAGMHRNEARQRMIDEQVSNYVYQNSLEAVFPQARTLLFEQGYQTRDASSSFLVETDWRPISSDVRRRYMVTGIPSGEGGGTVHFILDEERLDSGSAVTGRDLSLEWLLIRRVEPDRAAQIESDANAYAYHLYPES